MSDEAYSSFLAQANQDTGESEASADPKSAATKDIDTYVNVPADLQKVQQDYTSESDEPFEPVSLKWGGKKMPSESEFGTIVGHDSDVSTLSTGVFDPQGHYRQVIEAVEQLGYGKTRIYRVKYGKTRVEYYVVVFDHEGARVVGLKAKAVES